MGIINLKHLFPRASKEFHNLNSEIQNPKFKSDKKATLGETVSRKEKVLERITVSYRLFRVRPLDADNAAGSIKDCQDGLCRCGLIPSDDPWTIKIEVMQEQVAKYDQERTEVTIIYPMEELPRHLKKHFGA